MKVEILRVVGFDEAVKGMRLAYTSKPESSEFVCSLAVSINKDDVALMTRLASLGSSHSKFARFIEVYLDITAPRYWWMEFDTYKVGAERLSESTMHTIMNRSFKRVDFQGGDISVMTLAGLNSLRIRKKFEKLKCALPEGYLQRRIVKVNYQALRGMYFDRRNHRLVEWKDFCATIEKGVPFSDIITVSGRIKNGE